MIFLPNVPEKMIRTLWEVFNTFFSLKDVEKEIAGEVKVALCGDSARVEELYVLMKKRETHGEEDEHKTQPLDAPETLRIVKFPPSDEDTAFLKESHVAVFIMDEKTFDIDLLRSLQEKVPFEEKKIIWFVDGHVDSMRREEIADQFKEIAVETVHWTEDEWEKLSGMVLERVSEHSLAYAVKFSFLRNEMSRRLVEKTAQENASISFFSSLPTNIPLIGIIIGLLAVTGETLFMTANQLRMCLRIAGIYGYRIDFSSRMQELWPVLAGAFGWRTLARGLTGFIPGGGPILKATIAYAGTKATGEAARWYYRDGKKITRDELKELYAQEKSKILDNVNGFLQQFKSKDTEGPPENNGRAE
jgi:uncharacterized protein (DUF697 family)